MNQGEILILGCGTSTGVPVPGCHCPVCQSTDPKNNRLRTSAVVSIGEQRILIDASPDLRQQALAHGVERIDAVLYTHAHADHIMGTDDLRSFNFASRKPIPCFGSDYTLSRLKQSFFYVFTPDPKWQGGMLPQLELHRIQHYDSFIAAECEVLPFELEHGEIIVSGFRIGGLAYATDCKRISDQAFEALRGVEVLILDGLREEQHKTHLSFSEAIDVAQRIGAKETYLTHMTHSVDYAEASRELPPGIALAYDGLRVKFKL